MPHSSPRVSKMYIKKTADCKIPRKHRGRKMRAPRAARKATPNSDQYKGAIHNLPLSSHPPEGSSHPWHQATTRRGKRRITTRGVARGGRGDRDLGWGFQKGWPSLGEAGRAVRLKAPQLGQQLAQGSGVLRDVGLQLLHLGQRQLRPYAHAQRMSTPTSKKRARSHEVTRARTEEQDRNPQCGEVCKTTRSPKSKAQPSSFQHTLNAGASRILIV